MEKKKILIVDDSPTQLHFEKMLLGFDFDIVTADNGRIALEKAIKESPDIILMDIFMPELDGMESLKAIRSFPATSSIPVIMVTTKSEEERVEACFKLGCNDYITKPVNRTELLTKIAKHIKEDSKNEAGSV